MNLRTIWPVVGAVILAAAGAAVVVRDKPLTVEWTIVSRTMEGTILAAGHVAESGITPVYPLLSGTISRVVVAEGASVSAGDTLVQLDDQDERARQARCAVGVTIALLRLEEQSAKEIGLSREKVASATALESLAAKKCLRGDSLFLQGSITLAELDETKMEFSTRQSGRVIAETELAAASSTGIDLLKAELSQARLALEDAERALSRTVVTAPVSGNVIDLAASKGGRASPGQPFLQIVSHESSIFANVQVDEEALLCLHTGQKARIRCDRDVAIDAVVVAVTERIDTATLRAKVILSMEQPRPPLIAGRTVVARIVSKGAAGSILLDRRFRFGTAQFGYVLVKSGNHVLRRLVRCENIDDEIVSIRRGVAPGDTVVFAAGLSEKSSIRLARKPVGPVEIPGL